MNKRMAVTVTISEQDVVTETLRVEAEVRAVPGEIMAVARYLNPDGSWIERKGWGPNARAAVVNAIERIIISPQFATKETNASES